jgi:hypothetical protein
MPFPDLTGWGGPQQYDYSSQPPQYVLDQMGGSYDQSRYYWNPDTFSLVDRYNGGSYQYSQQDPANGTNVITNYGNDAQQTINYGAGETPYFGFGDSAQGYNGGDAPNSGMFISADPYAIDEYQSHRQDVVNQGIAQVGAVVGGAALGGALGGGGSASGTAGYGGAATTTPYAAGNYAGGAIAGSAIPGVTSAATAAAAGGSGVLGAAGGATGSMPSWVGNYLMPGLNAGLGIYGANQASDAMSDASNAAIAEGARQYDTTRADLMPWMQAGQGALGRMQDPNAFQASPGYEWARNEGMRDIGNSFAARGGAASGNALRALSEFQTGLAQQDYGNWWNQQAGLAGVGQTATTAVGQFGANNAARTGNYLQDQGSARASGILGRTNSVQNGLYDGYDNYLYGRRRRVA